jgi:multidrug efflux pump subunit AcrA (membrane-fusion protein)
MTTLPKPSPTTSPLNKSAVSLPPAQTAPPPTQTVETTVENTPPPARGSGLLWTIVLLIIAAAVGYAIYAGIHGRTQAESSLTDSTQASAVPTVVVVHPKPNTLTSEISLPGNTQAFIDTPIYARASGYLKAWHADIGARVKQGELLAEIETPELDQQLEQSQASLKDAQANLEISRTTNARYQALLGSHSVSQQEAAQTASDLAAKQALVDAAAANVRQFEQEKAFQKIYAPFDGVITARNIDIGALIQSGDNTTPHELFHLAAIDKLRVYIAVPEVYAPSVQDGEAVTLTLDSYPGETFNGKVVRIPTRSIRRPARSTPRSTWTTPRAGSGRAPMRSCTCPCMPTPARSSSRPTRCFSARRDCALAWCATAKSSWCRSPSATITASPSRSFPA